MRIAIDVMGGDLGPGEVVRGVAAAAREPGQTASFILVGDESVVRAELERARPVPPSVQVRHASQIIGMHDRPSEAYRRKPDASVVVAARLVRDDEANAFISIGNTGAAMAAAVYLLRPIEGIDRPAIATPLPSLREPVVLLDAGANVDCSPHQILEFAIMGLAYARRVLGRTAPSVALLSNGEEDSKGNELTRAAHKLLRESIPAFSGNIEGREVFGGMADVVVCDGFAGNILLKTGEGVAEMVLNMVREELTRHRWMSLPLLLLQKRLRALRSRIDYREFGGAPLLGVNGVCIVGHGRSDARAIGNAIRVAAASVEQDLVQEIARDIAARRSPQLT
ncbi:MAG: phosphate acyltransferase PlsX [Chthonomonadales bacterium]|nr:phosphate acyltransferase PlsX [Chthonomonadales bacterium]